MTWQDVSPSVIDTPIGGKKVRKTNKDFKKGPCCEFPCWGFTGVILFIVGIPFWIVSLLLAVLVLPLDCLGAELSYDIITFVQWMNRLLLWGCPPLVLKSKWGIKEEPKSRPADEVPLTKDMPDDSDVTGV